MAEKVLFVDDEPNVLAAHERQLRRRYALDTAAGGEEAIARLAAAGPFAVVVTDLRMPGVDGIRLLAHARERHPDTVRILLTGYADVQQAIQAVNEGNVFRFLTKPCGPETLTAAIDAGLAQYRLVTAERELLEKTLRGTVQVLGEVLAAVNPTAFGRSVRAQRLVRELAGLLGDGYGGWEAEVAAALSQLGCVAVPEAVLAATHAGRELTPDQRRQLDGHPTAARDLLRPIPRLERVTEIVAAQAARADTSGVPPGARLLRVALDFDDLIDRGEPKPRALAALRGRAGWYDPAVLDALGQFIAREVPAEPRSVMANELAAGMVLADDLRNDAGALLLSRGHPITDTLRRRLMGIALSGRLSKPIRVLVPPGVG